METTESAGPGDWVRIGTSAIAAVVVRHVSDDALEVVYIDPRDRAINEEVSWRGGSWQFSQDGPCGGYADGLSRLRRYVEILRQGPPAGA